MKQYVFHVIGLPHTKISKEYLPCAYSQKTLNFCKMMKSLGHKVILYAPQGSDPSICDQLVEVVTDSEQERWFGHTNWRKDFFPIQWEGTEEYWTSMNSRVIGKMHGLIQPKDFICVIAGSCQKPIADAFATNQTVEFGIGYYGTFSRYRVFESYAHMHYCYGKQGTENGNYYDCVIPNYFDPNDFQLQEKKEDYFLYIGRMIWRKGVHVAAEACGIKGEKLKLAGQGATVEENRDIRSSDFVLSGKHLEYVGVVGVKERSELMGKAKAVFVPTQYIGPFEGVMVEANFCGTPVITTDWGCFTENVVDGLNGFRTRTMGEMLWAMDNVDLLDPKEIRKYAEENFSLDRVKLMYQAYFDQLYQLWGEGWNSLEYDALNERYWRYRGQS